MQDERGFWDRLTERTTPSGALATIENVRTVVRLVAGALWGATVLAAVSAAVLFRAGEPAAGWVTAGLSASYFTTWVWHAASGRVTGPVVLATAATIGSHLATHVLLGGYANSGANVMWGITMTFVLALMMGRRAAIGVAAFYVALAIVFAGLESTLAASRPAPSPALSATLFAAVLIGNLVMVSSIIGYFLFRLRFERERAEGLLLNVLPGPVAAELKERGTTTARRYDSISVLFADVVGFTTLSAGMDPEEMLEQLNEVFTHFDLLADRYGCEKIRTIGDAYMVASGLPVAREDHAHALASMALDMLAFGDRTPLNFRLGMNSGPALAGVIGTRKFQYDVWGDTVNTASRMESHGEPGRVQITEATHRLIADDFVCTPRGPVTVKGLGTVDTWYLEARRPATRVDVAAPPVTRDAAGPRRPAGDVTGRRRP